MSHAQAASTLPKTWNDAVAKLGDEVAAAMSPTAVALSVENISSLDASYVAAVGTALREQLQHHSFSLSAANSTAAQSAVPLQLTLSESAGEYLWVVQIPGDVTDAKLNPTMIVSVSKSDSTGAEPEQQSLSLEKRFVWKQAERVLDFALSKDASSGELTLLVLGAKRLSTYKPVGSQWQLSRTSPMPQATPPSRDPQGTINLKDAKISLNGFECFGDTDLAGVLRCSASKPNHNLAGLQVKVPGYLNSLGTSLSEKCLGEFVFLFTAESDWTQSDSIQARLTKGIPLPLVPSGNTLEFDGPVMALHSDPNSNSARAIVHNLKSGEYEAYIVTATCGN